MNNQHLSDEDFSQMLAGCSDAEALRHLESCAQCRGELEDTRASLENMNHLGMLWAEQQAPHRVPLPLHGMSRWSMRSVWLVPATLMVLCVLLLGINRQHERNADQFNGSSTPRYTVADDNRLMAAIDQELNREVVPQVPVSDLRAPAARHHRPVGQLVNE
jgi:hypothetical protein